MRFDTKIAIAVRDDLPQWQKLNVTAFLASGIASAADGLLGKPYEDADGNEYLALFRQPVVVYAADAEALLAALGRARDRGLAAAVYTEEMFATGNDEDNRAVVRVVAADDLRLAGLAVYGPRNPVDKVFKGARLHPLPVQFVLAHSLRQARTAVRPASNAAASTRPSLARRLT